MAAPVLQAFATGTADGASSITVPVPAGVVDGDLLVASIANSGTGAITAPGGWTLIRTEANAGHGQLRTYYRIASSEPASYDWTWAGSLDSSGTIARITGHDPVTPVDASNGGIADASATVTGPGVTTTRDDCLLLFVGMARNNVTFSGYTSPFAEQWDFPGLASVIASQFGATATQAGIGASGDKTATASGSCDSAAQLIAIRPPAPLHPEIRAVATGTADGVSPITVPVPAGVVDGDLLIASVGTSGSGAITAPGGWTLIDSEIDTGGPQLSTYWRIASSEPASYDWTYAGALDGSGAIARITGHDPTAPIDANASQITLASATVNGPSITTTRPDILLLFVGIIRRSNTTFSAYTSAFLERWEVALSTITASQFGATDVQAVAGATGAKTATASGSDDNVGQLLAIRRAPITNLLEGVASGAAQASGVLRVTHTFAGTASGVGTTVGALQVIHTFAGTASGVGTLVGTLTVGFTIAIAPSIPRDLATRYEIWIADPAGRRLGLVEEWEALAYVRRLGDRGAFQLALPADFDLSRIGVDFRVEIWRGVGQRLYLDTETTWLVRSFEESIDDSGRLLKVVSGPSAVDVLRRRIVAYAAGAPEADKTGAADLVMYEIVTENFGSAAGASRDVSTFLQALAPPQIGASLTKAFSRRNVLEVLREISDATLRDAVPIFFDVVWTGAVYQFRCYANQRGANHGRSSPAPVVFSPDAGNLEVPRLLRDFSEEITDMYAGGQGEGTDRAVSSKSDDVRHRGLPFGRLEAWQDANQTSSLTSLDAEALAALRAGAPRVQLSGRIIDTPATRYGLHWGWGDRAVQSAFGQDMDVWIEAVSVEVHRDGGENVQAIIREVP